MTQLNTKLLLSESSNADWDMVCDKNYDFFNHSNWHKILTRSFNCTVLYARSENESQNISISSFKAGPLVVGYLGFPVGTAISDNNTISQLVSAIQKSSFTPRIHCMRIPVDSTQTHINLNCPHIVLPETVINDLASWSPGSVSKNLRRDITRARKHGYIITDDIGTLSPDILFKLYESTIMLHGGRLRYNRSYFTLLHELSKESDLLRFIFAKKDDEIAAFVVTVIHGNQAYYLHGATNNDHRSYSPGNILLCDAIQWAKDMGKPMFNLMVSGKKQRGLIRYKERWGATTGQHRTHTCTVDRLYCPLFRLGERIHNILR